MQKEWEISLIEQVPLDFRSTLSMQWHGCSMCGSGNQIRFTIFSASESPHTYLTPDEAKEVAAVLLKMSEAVKAIRLEHGGK